MLWCGVTTREAYDLAVVFFLFFFFSFFYFFLFFLFFLFPPLFCSDKSAGRQFSTQPHDQQRKTRERGWIGADGHSGTEEAQA